MGRDLPTELTPTGGVVPAPDRVGIGRLDALCAKIHDDDAVRLEAMREQRRGNPAVSSFALALLDHLQRLRLVELRFNNLDRFSIPEERQRVDGVRIRARATHDVATVGRPVVESLGLGDFKSSSLPPSPLALRAKISRFPFAA